VAILQAATTFFAGHSTPAADDHGLHPVPARGARARSPRAPTGPGGPAACSARGCWSWRT
jgi:hypothetical protein